MKLNRIFWAGVAVWIVSVAYSWLVDGGIFSWVYKLAPISLWKGSTGMLSSGDVAANLIIGLVMAWLFVAAYAMIVKSIPGKGVMKGFTYGLLVWMVGTLPGVISMPFYMNINVSVVIYWIIGGLVLNMVNGAIVASMYQEKKK